MAEKSDWKTKMRKHLGKPLQKHYNSLMLDIILICIGLKPSLLFDYWCIDPVKVAKLLQDLHKSGFTPVCLDVVVLGQDLFITEINGLLKILKENMNTKNFSLIDVSSHLEKPRQVAEETKLEIFKHFDGLLRQLDEKFHVPGIPENHFYNVDVQQGWNLSTIFGFLLSYPVIYWFDSKEHSNCLSLVHLYLYRTYVKIPFYINPSVSKSFDEFASKVLKETSLDGLKLVFSFSFPQHLSSVVEEYVQGWTKYMKKKSLFLSLDEQVSFDKTLMVEKEVIL